MKRALGVAPFVLLTSLTLGWGGNAAGAKGEDTGRHTEAEGGFSFVPPKGWTIRAFSILKFKVAVGPAAAGFAPNINVGKESFNGSLEAYMKQNMGALSKAVKNLRLVKQDSFETTAGLKGTRTVTESEQRGKLLRQTFYVFARGDTKFVVTCTALAEGGEKLDPVFEASMKTFRLDKK